MSARRIGARVAAALLAGLLPAGAPREAAAVTVAFKYPVNGHWYKLVTSPTPLTWAASKIGAEALGGYLATVTTYGENLWVSSYISASGPAFLGASDAAVEGTWAWVTGEPGGYANWAPGEPDDPDGTEDFLVTNAAAVEYWSDVADGGSGVEVYRYVVEWNCDPNAPRPLPHPPDGTPSDLTATPLFNGTILLSWTDNISNEDWFEVERRDGDEGAFHPLGTSGWDVPRYQDHAVRSGDSYAYRVRAVNACGVTDWCPEAVAVAEGILPSPTPRSPSGLLAFPSGPRAVDLSWIDQSADEIAFEVGRRTGDGEFGYVAMAGADAVSFRDEGLAADGDYRYRLRTVSATGVSPAVEVDAATPPSLEVTALRGRVRDSAQAGRDSFRFTARYEFLPGASDGVADPAAEGVAVRAGGEGSPVLLRVPPGAAGWKARGARWTWRGPRGSDARYRVRVDLDRRVVTASVRGIEMAVPPTNPVRVSVGIGDDGGSDRSEWGSPGPGVFRLR